MVEFNFKFRANHKERCGWCLDWIFSPAFERPKICPYCGADLSTKSPRHGEMMEDLKHNNEIRQRDQVLLRLRRYQYEKKYGLMEPKFEQICPSPLVVKVYRLWPAGEGTLWSGGEELQRLVEHIHLYPNDPGVELRKRAVLELGRDLYKRGGVDSLETEFVQLRDDLTKKYTPDFDRYRSLWNGICDEWKY